jgi:hypothetical protein
MRHHGQQLEEELALGEHVGFTAATGRDVDAGTEGIAVLKARKNAAYK